MSEEALRRALPDEASAIADVWLRSRRAAAIPSPAHADDQVRAWIQDVLLPSAEVWVATATGQVVGMLALNDGCVEQLYVAPEWQRQGHGGRLIERAQALRDSLTLWTFESNLQAQRFYEAHGFARTGVVSDRNEERAPAVLYRWRRSV